MPKFHVGEGWEDGGLRRGRDCVGAAGLPGRRVGVPAQRVRGARRLAEQCGFCPQGTGKSTKDLVLFVVFYVRNPLV